jgi:hypothetical protein
MEENFETPLAAYVAEASKGKSSPAERFQASLMGFLIYYFRTHPECISQADLVTKVSPLLPTLKRADGSHYNEDATKAVLACLHTGAVFEQSAAGWTLNVERAELYERRVLMSLAKRDERTAETSRVPKRERQKKARTALKHAQKLSAYLKAQPELHEELSDPLQRVRGNESLKSLQRRLGREHLYGLLQGYAAFNTYFAQLYPRVMLRRKHSMKKILRQLFKTLAETQEALELID